MKGTIARITTSGNTAIVMLKTTEHSVMAKPVYVTNKDYKVKEVVEFPDHLKIVDWEGHFTKSGIQLKTLSA